MKEKDTAITKRGPAKRDSACLQVRYTITIPAGTILRQEPGKEGTFSCSLAGGKFVIDRTAAEQHTGSFRKVVA